MSEVAIFFNPSQSLSGQVRSNICDTDDIWFCDQTNKKQGWNGLKMHLEPAFLGSRWVGGNFWLAVRLELSRSRAFGPVADSDPAH